MAPSSLVWFITGANSGFGLLLSQLALSKGHTVVATARSLSKFPKSLRDTPKADLVEIQVTAPASEIAAAVDAAAAKHGRVDVLVNNAGFGHMGAVEEVSDADLRYQFDVNFLGLVNFTRAVIPHMRKQGSGVILQLSSGVGILAPQGAPVYAASKFAVEGLSESMREELKPFGIRVHIVEPGVFRTEFLQPIAQGNNISANKHGYVDLGGMLQGMNGNQPGDPEKGVQRMYEIVTGDGMGAGVGDMLRIPLGSDCFGMLATKIQSLTETHDKAKQIAVSTDY
jgi:NAD(P)-dependent dehydrogenase (short-subunit alcohol dehydrogenase family)